MAVSGRAIDRLVSIAIYAGFGCLSLWAGIALINHSLGARLYKDFLLGWEVAAVTYTEQGGVWPPFSGGNHVEYMEQVTRLFCSRGLSLPESNTGRPYLYRFDKIGAPEEDIFLLCFSQRIILYGLSSNTFTLLDSYIDGKDDPEEGRFQGRLSRDGISYTGVWQL